MDHDGQLRNLRDFLLVYNRMTEICFQRCTSNFNYRNLTMDEERCVDSCAGKLIRTNHRLMGTYVQLMPAMVQKRMQEMESKAAEVAKAEAAAHGGAIENPPPVMMDTQPVPPSIPGIPATTSSVEIPSAFDHASSGLTMPSNMTPQIASAHNHPSEIITSPLVFESATQATETAKVSLPFMSTSEASLPAVSPNAQTDPLQGTVTVSPVISTSTSSSVGSLSSAVAGIPVEKLNLNPSSLTAISASETRSTAGTAQISPKTS
ncbi:mitochondrial import inner membrane translocase subunit Tim10 B [Paramisgurnus dabryanus]|uniref:mitochondrial import inner membrane translocase subunit Tim10 B n=1 Tax=Paramisgurnus dabryanus TaxID=90735 RepID=UPI0031F3E05D